MGDERMRKRFSDFLSNPMSMNVYSYVDDNPVNKIDPSGLKGCKSGGKSFQECTITITYDPASSHGKLVVTGKADGDKGPTVLLESSVVVGGDGHVTPVGTFTASRWENDHVSKLYGHWANTPYSKTIFGMNAFGPHQLHIKELESTFTEPWGPITHRLHLETPSLAPHPTGACACAIWTTMPCII